MRPLCGSTRAVQAADYGEFGEYRKIHAEEGLRRSQPDPYSTVQVLQKLPCALVAVQNPPRRDSPLPHPSCFPLSSLYLRPARRVCTLEARDGARDPCLALEAWRHPCPPLDLRVDVWLALGVCTLFAANSTPNLSCHGQSEGGAR